jgi:outer membrane receptor protein involved in Fe transport
MIAFQKIKNRHLILILFTFFFMYHSLAISKTIKGVVRDKKTNDPIENVLINIKKTNNSTYSDSFGLFLFKIDTLKEVVLSASMVGYKTQEKQVKFQNDSAKVVFFLESLEYTADSVLVLANRYRDVFERPTSESAALDVSISTITRKQIEAQGAKTVVDAMKFIPGALVETRGRKVKQFFSVSGQTYPYPEYAIDGTWQREFHETPYFFSTLNIERIEVVRSSAVFLRGIPNMAGMINIVPRKYETSQTTVESEYGTFGTYLANLSHGNTVTHFSYSGGIGYQGTDGPAGKYAAEKMLNAYGTVNWKPLATLTLDFSIFYLNGSRRIAQAEPPAAQQYQTALWSYDPFKSTLANLKAHYRPKKNLSTEIQTSFAHREPRFIVEDEETHIKSCFSEEDYEYNLNIIQAIGPFKDNILRFGGNYNRWIAPNGKRFYTGKRNDLETFSWVVVDEHQIGRLCLDGGWRWSKTYIYDYAAFNIDGSARGLTNVEAVTDEWEPAILQGMFGAVYYFPKNYSLHFNLANGKIEPRRGTLDVNLEKPKSENRTQVDIGVKAQWEKFGELSLTGFYTNQKNAINLSGQTYTVDERLQELYLNRDQNQIGLEINFNSRRFLKNEQLFLNLTYMNSREKEEYSWIRDREIPRFILNSGISGSWFGIDAFLYARYISLFESIRFAGGNPPEPQSLGDYLEWDFTIDYPVNLFYKTIVYVEIKNLTNRYYSTVVGYPDYGRRITVGFRQNF